MPNVLVHTFVGALTGLLIASIFNIPWEFRFLAGLIALVFSFLPDLDHPKATARRIYRKLGKFALAALYVPLLYSIGLGLFETFFISLVLGVLSIYALEGIIPRHRGIMHSVPFAIILGIVMYLLLLSFNVKYALFLSLSAFAGYASHIFLDRVA